MTSALLPRRARRSPPRAPGPAFHVRLWRAPTRAGQALVEFALVGPLFFGLVMLTIEAALLMNAQLTLDNATREAARAAAVCGDGKGAFGGASGGATCEQLAESALSANLGIVAVLGAAPGLHFDTPTDPANSGCGPSGGAYNGAPQGCPIVLSTSYTFTFLLGSLMGSAAPGIGLSSQAAVVSQR